MKILDPGHEYKLSWLDVPEGLQPFIDRAQSDVLVFVKREGEGYPGNTSHYAGTNLQEVLRACIDRVKYLDNQILDDRNTLVLAHLRSAIWQLETRAAARHGRVLSGFHCNEVETYPTCPRCGHIGCEGTCHA